MRGTVPKALFTPDEYSAETVVIYSGEQQS